ncbi:MAG: ureidoglycolate lyase [Proteobacteria bacterium]|nr:ureidoglycolate lyase [Pseudomonadota bacterium]
MHRSLQTQPLTATAFSTFGDLIGLKDLPDQIINQGFCGRHHDLATPEIIDGHAGISLFKALPRALPYRLEMMERHPLGSQAFIPMSLDPFLVIVAPDNGGAPGTPLAFVTAPGQGVNFHRGTWHGVLTPLTEPGLFAVIDRIGAGRNLQEYWFEEIFEITDGRAKTVDPIPAVGDPRPLGSG